MIRSGPAPRSAMYVRMCGYDNSARRASWGSLHPRHAHITVVRLYSFSRSPSFSSPTFALSLSRALLRYPLLLLSRRLVILQFHVLPYGNIVIFAFLPPSPRRCIFVRHRALVSAHLDSHPARPRIRDHAGTPSFGWMYLGDLGRIGSFWNALIAITINRDSNFAAAGNRMPNAFSKFHNTFT